MKKVLTAFADTLAKVAKEESGARQGLVRGSVGRTTSAPTGSPPERLMIIRLLIRRLIAMNYQESFSKWSCDSDWVA
jgi:hypothetical protein